MPTRFAIALCTGLTLSGLALMSGCAQNTSVMPESATKAETAGKTYGEAMPANPKPLALSTAMKTVDDFIGKPVKLSGRVGLVCQAKGCWMMLTDNDSSVRVKFGNDAFFIPKDSKGEAVVFGKLELIVMNPAHAKHMAEDAGVAPASAAAAPTKEYRVMATSVVLAGS